MGVERSAASVCEDAERRCELSFQMGNGEFHFSPRYGTYYSTWQKLEIPQWSASAISVFDIPAGFICYTLTCL